MAQSGTALVGVHPAGGLPAPAWVTEVPSLAARFDSAPLSYEVLAGWVTVPMERHGLSNYRLWWVDVPQYFLSARNLYDTLVAPTSVAPRSDGAAWAEARPAIEAAFDRHQKDGAVSFRHLRLVWTAQLP